MLPLGRAASAAVIGVVVLTCAACVGAGPEPADTSPPAAAAASFDSTPEDFDAIRVLLRERARAIEERDLTAFLATVDPESLVFRARQRTVFANLTALPLRSVRYAVSDFGLTPAEVRGDDPVLAPEVSERVSLRRVLDAPLGSPAAMTFVQRDGRWLLAAEGPPPGTEPGPRQVRPWIGVPIEAALVDDVLALTRVDAAVDAADLAARVRDDRAQAASLLGLGDVAAPVVVDATPNGAVTTMSSRTADDASAIMQTLVSPTGRRAGALVQINPDAVDRLVGDRELMRHELTHVLLEDSLGEAPLWATEGIAEYVGGFPQRVTASPQGLRDLATLTVLPRSPGFAAEARLNYPRSRAIVQSLIGRFGMERFLGLLDAYVEADLEPYGDTGTAEIVRQVYGLAEREIIALTIVDVTP